MQARFGVDGAEEGLDESRELLGLGPLAAGAAVGADDVGHAVLRGLPVLGDVRLDEVVLTVTVVAVEAFDERVDEGLDMARRFPHPLGQDDRGVEADDVLTTADEGLPPLGLDVVLEFDAERAVVPRRAGTAVDLPRLEDESSALGEGDDGIELGLCHVFSLVFVGPTAGCRGAHTSLSVRTGGPGEGGRRWNSHPIDRTRTASAGMGTVDWCHTQTFLRTDGRARARPQGCVRFRPGLPVMIAQAAAG